jgi:mannosyl-oligosaccharide glucosidase
MITKQVIVDQGGADEKLLFRPRLLEIYGKLKRHFGWFLANQRATLLGKKVESESESEPFLFRWRGRNKHHTLTSGLDDYPRGNVPSKYELHVDLLSWMGLMAKSLNEMAAALEIEETGFDYAQLYAEAKANLAEFHWDDERGCFADCTVNASGDALEFVPNTGYVSLFPMLFGLVDADDAKLGRLFDILEDSNQLWSE